MCLPVSCLKFILSFFAAITLIIGLAGIIVGSIELARIGHVDFATFNPAQVAPGLMLGTGIIALFVGIVGLVGSSRKSKCCLCIYQFSVLPMVLLSLALACVATYVTVNIGEMEDVQAGLANCKWNEPTSSCNKCGNKGGLEWIAKANEALFTVDTQVLGHKESCQIYAASAEQQTFYENLGFTFVTQDGSKGVKSALDCQLTNTQKQWGQFISYFESQYKCSGMCAATPFYAFYKTTEAVPQDVQSCYMKVANYLSSDLVTGISWGIFAFFLLNLTLACCLCCHPERKKDMQGEALYTRMNYYE